MHKNSEGFGSTLILDCV